LPEPRQRNGDRCNVHGGMPTHVIASLRAYRRWTTEIGVVSTALRSSSYRRQTLACSSPRSTRSVALAPNHE
jgi:hypothetical protein